jgi:hypothetical protein
VTGASAKSINRFTGVHLRERPHMGGWRWRSPLTCSRSPPWYFFSRWLQQSRCHGRCRLHRPGCRQALDRVVREPTVRVNHDHNFRRKLNLKTPNAEGRSPTRIAESGGIMARRPQHAPPTPRRRYPSCNYQPRQATGRLQFWMSARVGSSPVASLCAGTSTAPRRREP